MAVRVRLALVALAALGRGDDAWGDPVMLVDRGYPDARCNDGASAAYYFRAGAAGREGAARRDGPTSREKAARREGANVFVYLQGGFWCWDSKSCDLRWNYWNDPANQARWGGKHLMSSKTLDNRTLNGNTPAGITDLSRANAFRDFDVYYAPYCSSDAWLGATRGEAADEFAFRGRDIVRALAEEVRTRSGTLGTVLLGGTSAGGLGTIHSVDLFKRALRPAGAAGASVDLRALRPAGAMGTSDASATAASLPFVVGVPDGGWFMDVEPAGPCAQESDEMWASVCGKPSGDRVDAAATTWIVRGPVRPNNRATACGQIGYHPQVGLRGGGQRNARARRAPRAVRKGLRALELERGLVGVALPRERAGVDRGAPGRAPVADG